MLTVVITILHVVVCVVLILVVLLQSGKGADLAGAFGGGSTQTAFGSRGPASFLSKMTTVAAVLFMITCISLSMLGGRRSDSSVLDGDAGSSIPTPVKPEVSQQAAPTPDEIKRIQDEAESKQNETETAPQPPSEEPKP